MAAVGFDLDEMDDLDSGRGEWINTPEIIRSTLKQLIISAQHERRERIKAQETVEVGDRQLAFLPLPCAAHAVNCRTYAES